MSTTIPTPADVFRRQTRQAPSLTASEPHTPDVDPPYRLLWEQGINGARLLVHTKLVALTLATRADWTTGVIPDAAQPRLGGLIGLTRLDAGDVVASLTFLEQRFWIERVDRRQRWNEAAVRLTAPGPVMRRLLDKARAART
ncbi:hypothetical protein ACFY84_29895 [Streptomyces sp. NPDC012438]|uniref:hypothetical protein n=1 Tax=Streptomyces sp. NPDC012438 TaxID=3364833 RepID=UPI0036E0CDB2